MQKVLSSPRVVEYQSFVYRNAHILTRYQLSWHTFCVCLATSQRNIDKMHWKATLVEGKKECAILVALPPLPFEPFPRFENKFGVSDVLVFRPRF